MEKSEQKHYALEQAAGSSENEIYLSVLDKIKAHNMLDSAKSLLDIGCGKGHFLKILNSNFKGKDLTGSDLFDYSSELSFDTKWVKQDLNLKPSENFQKYEIVTAIEVIEHLENPRKFIREFSQLLTPGGFFVITTPNLESFTSLISFFLRGYHSAFGDRSYPAHITAVSARDINLMVNENNGLKVIEQYFIPNGRVPGNVIKWKSFFPFLQGKRFSDNYITIIQKS